MALRPLGSGGPADDYRGMAVTEEAMAAIDRVRFELEDCGTPAYTAVAVLGDGSWEVSALTFAAAEPAKNVAGRLTVEHPGARVYLVSRHADRSHVRFNVHDADGVALLHRQDEVVEQPIGANELL